MKRIAVVFLVLFALPALLEARSNLLTNVRYWKAPEYVRVVVDLKTQTEFTHRVLSNPHRIAVDIRGTKFESGVRKIRVNDDFLIAIRMNALRSGTAQIVLDLERPVRYHIFPLAPVGDKPHRIVIDLFNDEQTPVRKPVDTNGEVRRIIIDPGHGGEDPGAVGLYKLMEKEIVFDVARLLAAKVNALPGYEALLTRKGDYFLSLRKRTEFAHDRHGDMFISLHVNSARSGRARGFEVFFLSHSGATNKLAKELADKENAADLIGGVAPGVQDDVISILFDYLQEEGMRKSEILAEGVYHSFRDDPVFNMRNVKQAGFGVLKSMEIPAILVELGFISNREDASNLRKSAFRNKLADNLLMGIEEYYAKTGNGKPKYHVVRRGETVWSIARTYRIETGALLSANNMNSGSVLTVGRRLRIP